MSKIYCEVCCAKFPTKWSLQKHTKMKHAETMFSCSQCTKSFLFQSNLEKHIEEIHADVQSHRTDGNIVIAIKKKKVVTKNPKAELNKIQRDLLEQIGNFHKVKYKIFV